MSFVITLLALGFVIFIHELGHLLAAKRVRVGVTEFAIGMGPKVFSFHFRDTMYSLRLLPFGGFVRAKGLDDMDSCPIEEDYREKSALAKAFILVAGSAMNLLLGFLIFTSIALVVGEVKLSSTINGVLDNSPAQLMGLQDGDKIIKINDIEIDDVTTDLIKPIKESNGASITLTFIRDNIESTVTITPEKRNGDNYQIGVSFGTSSNELGVFQSIKFGFMKSLSTISQSFLGIKMLISGQASVNELAGPVGIIQIASSQIQHSMVAFFSLMAFISISLGVINLFPFPVLDGGHLLFLLIETLRGKPLSKNVEMVINNTAAFILIGLMMFIVFNDVISWNDRVNLIKEMNR
jgi:regulator of sigma E protease